MLLGKANFKHHINIFSIYWEHFFHMEGIRKGQSFINEDHLMTSISHAYLRITTSYCNNYYRCNIKFIQLCIQKLEITQGKYIFIFFY